MRRTWLFFVAVFGCCSGAECRIVSKCELRTTLTEALAAQTNKFDDNFVAKMVCHAERASQFNTSLEKSEEGGLYGLFQLSSPLTCSSGSNQPSNICGMDCTDLLDDDTQDDIECLLTIFRNLVKNGFGAEHWNELRKMIRLILQEECRKEKASQYFADCFINQ